jgi:hypothetical protein
MITKKKSRLKNKKSRYTIEKKNQSDLFLLHLILQKILIVRKVGTSEEISVPVGLQFPLNIKRVLRYQ